MGAKVTARAGKGAVVTDEIKAVKEKVPTLQWNNRKVLRVRFHPTMSPAVKGERQEPKGVSCSWKVCNRKRLQPLWSEEAGLPRACSKT